MSRRKAFVCLALALAIPTLGLVRTRAGDDPLKATPAKPPLPDRERVRNTLMAWWEGIETLQFRDVTYEVDKDGHRVVEGDRPMVEVVLGKGDRRSVTHGTLRKSGRLWLAQEKRDNGKIQCTLLSSKEKPETIAEVRLTDQKNKRDAYQGEMGTLLWLLTPYGTVSPVGKPLHLHIDDGAKLEIGRDPTGQPTVTLFIEWGNQRYELDPEHDYLPMRVTGDSQDIIVTKFVNENGRWFPVEGYVTDHGANGKKERRVFRVEGLRINRPIPDSRFEAPVDLGDARFLDFRRRVPLE
jgi:hypothetical protein